MRQRRLRFVIDGTRLRALLAGKIVTLADDVELVIDSTLVAAQAHRISGPRPGYWLVRLVRGGAEVPASIVLCEHEPGISDNPLDTGPVMVGMIDGSPCDPLDVWVASGRPITRREYLFRVVEQDKLHQHRPDDPKVNPRERVDISKMRTPF